MDIRDAAPKALVLSYGAQGGSRGVALIDLGIGDTRRNHHGVPAKDGGRAARHDVRVTVLHPGGDHGCRRRKEAGPPGTVVVDLQLIGRERRQVLDGHTIDDGVRLIGDRAPGGKDVMGRIRFCVLVSQDGILKNGARLDLTPRLPIRKAAPVDLVLAAGNLLPQLNCRYFQKVYPMAAYVDPRSLIDGLAF